ncbi:hypothetical protein [Silvimonas sp.]|uniref:DUF7303 family protein n=1 Tax=Silvimonas sp. TaxID=2650811 RepID=UPI00284AA1F0|nr:hypothetical protein [Silvimonas sp.]MDR3427778.1 hypothetical protein [Silvimonas sp.]
MFRVQKKVEIPHAMRHTGVSRRVYPYHEMDVGDFFFVPNKEKNTLSSHASAAGRKLERKFLTRLIHAALDIAGTWVICKADDDGAVQGIGVWRVE